MGFSERDALARDPSHEMREVRVALDKYMNSEAYLNFGVAADALWSKAFGAGRSSALVERRHAPEEESRAETLERLLREVLLAGRQLLGSSDPSLTREEMEAADHHEMHRTFLVISQDIWAFLEPEGCVAPGDRPVIDASAGG